MVTEWVAGCLVFMKGDGPCPSQGTLGRVRAQCCEAMDRGQTPTKRVGGLVGTGRGQRGKMSVWSSLSFL